MALVNFGAVLILKTFVAPPYPPAPCKSCVHHGDELEAPDGSLVVNCTPCC